MELKSIASSEDQEEVPRSTRPQIFVRLSSETLIPMLRGWLLETKLYYYTTGHNDRARNSSISRDGVYFSLEDQPTGKGVIVHLLRDDLLNLPPAMPVKHIIFSLFPSAPNHS